MRLSERPGGVHRDERRHHRRGDRDHDDQRIPDAVEEHEHDERDETTATARSSFTAFTASSVNVEPSCATST